MTARGGALGIGYLRLAHAHVEWQQSCMWPSDETFCVIRKLIHRTEVTDITFVLFHPYWPPVRCFKHWNLCQQSHKETKHLLQWAEASGPGERAAPRGQEVTSSPGLLTVGLQLLTVGKQGCVWPRDDHWAIWVLPQTWPRSLQGVFLPRTPCRKNSKEEGSLPRQQP